MVAIPIEDSRFFRGWLDASMSSMEMLLRSLDNPVETDDASGDSSLLTQDDCKRINKLSQALSIVSNRSARRARPDAPLRKLEKAHSNTSLNSVMANTSPYTSTSKQWQADGTFPTGGRWAGAGGSSKHRRPSFLEEAFSNQPRQLIRAIKEKIRPAHEPATKSLIRIQTSPPTNGHWADATPCVPTTCESFLPSVVPNPCPSSAIDGFGLRADLDTSSSQNASTDYESETEKRTSVFGKTLSMSSGRQSMLSSARLSRHSQATVRSSPSCHRLDKVAAKIIQESSAPSSRLLRSRSTVNLEYSKWRRFRCSRARLNSLSTMAASVAMLYSIILTPVVVCLGETPSIIESLFEVLCEVALLSTIAAPFLLGTDDPEKKVQLITSWSGVLKVYGRGWLCFDIVSLWPWHLIWLITGCSASAKWLLYLSICRLLKLPRLMTTVHLYLHGRRLHLTFHPNVLRAIRLIAFYFFVVHVAACGYYAVGSSYESQWSIYARDRSTTLSKWAQAFYWALCAVMGENMQAMSDEEVAYSSSIFALGVLLNSCIIGSITSLLGSLDERAAKRKSKLDTINTFMERSGVSPELIEQVQQYYLYLHSSVSKDGGLFDDLSSSLRLKIDLCIHKKFIGECNLFASCTPECIATLVTIISRNSVIYVPTELIFRKGDRGDGMYFVVKGEVVLFDPGEDLEDLDVEELLAMSKGDMVSDTTLFGTLHHGDSFGELALILDNSVRNLTAAALTFLELLCLPQRDFENVLCLYPTFADKIKDMVEHYAEDALEKAMEKHQGMTLNGTGLNGTGMAMGRLSEQQLGVEEDADDIM